jgi:ribosomal protein S18 acetylase RimI-like enzyme
MSSANQIRSAGRDDADLLVAFNIAMADETEGKRLSQAVVSAGVRGLFDRPEMGFYLVAEIGGEIAGCLMVTYEWSDWRNGCFWWIQSVYVKPPFRRRGVFKRLFEHVTSLAEKRSDVCGLRLYVERENEIAQHTYRSLGMCETEYRMFESSSIERSKEM